MRYLFMIFFVFITLISLTNAYSANRTIPDSYIPGNPITINITIYFDSIDCGAAYVEYIPSGWNVSSISGALFYSRDGRIMWFPINSSTCIGDEGSRTFNLGYVATPNIEQTENVTFNGLLNVDGNDNLLNNNSIQIKTNHPVDTNNNFQISLSEIISYLTCYKTSGCTWARPFNSIISLSYVINAVYLYRADSLSRYHFKATNCSINTPSKCWFTPSPT